MPRSLIWKKGQLPVIQNGQADLLLGFWRKERKKERRKETRRMEQVVAKSKRNTDSGQWVRLPNYRFTPSPNQSLTFPSFAAFCLHPSAVLTRFLRMCRLVCIRKASQLIWCAFFGKCDLWCGIRIWTFIAWHCRRSDQGKICREEA